MIYVRLFYSFFLVGLFAIGGGLATLPFLYDMAERTGWFMPDMIADMLALSEATPGPVGVNMATYAGYLTSGVLGGVVATIGLVAPSVIIILIVARVLEKFRENKYVKAVLYGLRPAVTALIATAGLSVMRITLLREMTTEMVWYQVFRLKELIFFFILFLLMRKIKLHPVFYILGSAFVGMILKL